jgi:hypothetical protein
MQKPLGYVYVISRSDIPQPHLSVQIAHATLAATNTYGDPNRTHPNLIVCLVENEPQLAEAFERLKASGVPAVAWTEEDMGRQLTAIATGILDGEQRKPLRRFRLMA